MNNKFKRKPGRPSRDDTPVNTADVLTCAWEIFSKHSYTQASMRTIANKAGVSSSLLAYLFGSKEALWYAAIHAIFDPLHQQHMDELDLLAASPDTGLHQVRQLMLLRIDQTLETPAPFQFLYREAEGDQPRARFLRETYLRPYLNKMYLVYHDACINSNLDAMDASTFLTFFISVVRFVFLPGSLNLLLPADKQDNDHIRQLLINILNQLLPAPNGRS